MSWKVLCFVLLLYWILIGLLCHLYAVYIAFASMVLICGILQSFMWACSWFLWFNRHCDKSKGTTFSFNENPTFHLLGASRKIIFSALNFSTCNTWFVFMEKKIEMEEAYLASELWLNNMCCVYFWIADLCGSRQNLNAVNLGV